MVQTSQGRRRSQGGAVACTPGWGQLCAIARAVEGEACHRSWKHNHIELGCCTMTLRERDLTFLSSDGASSVLPLWTTATIRPTHSALKFCGFISATKYSPDPLHACQALPNLSPACHCKGPDIWHVFSRLSVAQLCVGPLVWDGVLPILVLRQLTPRNHHLCWPACRHPPWCVVAFCHLGSDEHPTPRTPGGRDPFSSLPCSPCFSRVHAFKAQ